MKKQKLELTWIGKDERPQLEPRILIEDSEKSYHANSKYSENDIFDNKLIFGDNLLALKALEQEYTGKVKCIFIDPPYNTGAAFEHYDDGLEHSIWLGLIRDRLEILRNLLSNTGSLWITIDDNEAHYLKVLCDEQFGRANFVADIAWQKYHSVKSNAKFNISKSYDHLLVYAKDAELLQFDKIPMSEEALDVYKNPDNDPRGRWRTAPLTVSLMQGQRGEAYKKTGKSTGLYDLVAPNGKVHRPGQGRCWLAKAGIDALIADNRVWWGKDGNAVPMRKLFLDERTPEKGISTFWTHTDFGSNKHANEEMKLLFGEGAFDTPKPELLLKNILSIATDQNDIVLDSFAGSGTTGAVAHKMGRRWIMVELGEHCHTHIIPRMKKVIDGEDAGGITEAVNWHGGGGFRYYRLAPSLLQKDAWGNWVISKEFNSAMLAEAVCKLNGFTYAPSETVFWQHGYSTEQDFIYVTTQTLTREQLAKISEDVGESKSLLICCGAFRVNSDSFSNLTLRKIPKAVLSKCEWGRDDYSLKVNQLPLDELQTQPEPISNGHKARSKKERRAATTQGQLGLFEKGK